MKKKKETGFIQIELLFVVSVISIIADFLFPVFSKARQTALRMGCTSNLQQAGTLCHIYVSGNNGFAPEFMYDLPDADAA